MNTLAIINRGLVDAAGGETELAKARQQDADDLMKRIAMDIGKQVVDHIEHAYSRMCDAVAWESARLSIRNCTHNAFMEAVEASAKGEVEVMLERHTQHRRTMRKMRKANGQRY